MEVEVCGARRDAIVKWTKSAKGQKCSPGVLVAFVP